MSHETLILRVAIDQAACVLADEDRDLAERVAYARALLVAARETTDALSPAQRAVLDADPGVTAALARIAAGAGVYVRAGPDGGPSDERLEPTSDACAVAPDALVRLGLSDG